MWSRSSRAGPKGRCSQRMGLSRYSVMGIRRVAGAALFDVPSWRHVLAGRPGAWLQVSNRADGIQVLPDGSGVRLDGPWTSQLHAAKTLPWLGRRLFESAITEHPVKLAQEPSWDVRAEPEVTVVLGHRGASRLPHLQATLRSLAGQSGAVTEVIVVEQSTESEVGNALPAWVRHVHQPWPPGLGFGRSHAFNLAVGKARADVLVFHDNDMLVPSSYVASILRRVREGYEVVNLKRFVFYLTETDTEAFFATGILPPRANSEGVVQNLLGGGSVAATRAAFEGIGGFDEEFVGWGGEDEDFWQRGQTRRVFSWGCLPIVHLWHAPQPEKTPARDGPASRRLKELQRVPLTERIRALRMARGGSGAV